MLFPKASSVLLYPSLQCVHSAGTVAKVEALARVRGVPVACAAWLSFYCVISGAFSFVVLWDCVPPPSPFFIYLSSLRLL